jgi:hypothetical protein
MENTFAVSVNTESCNESGPYEVLGESRLFQEAQEIARAEARKFAEKYGPGYKGASFMVSLSQTPGVTDLATWSCYVDDDGSMHEGGSFPWNAGHRLLNLTPHSITLFEAGASASDAAFATLQPAGEPLRATVESKEMGQRLAFMASTAIFPQVKLLNRPTYGKVTAEPSDYVPNGTTPGSVGFIVSEIAARAILADPESPWRKHLLLGPAELVRDEKGQPIGCRALTLWSDNLSIAL